MRRHTIVLVLLALALPSCVTVDSMPPGQVQRRAKATRDVGIDHLSQGRTAMAVRELLEAEKLNADDYETQLWLGEAYRRKSKLEEAEAHILRAMELEPGSHTVELNYAGLLIQLERYDEAIAILEKLADDPTYSGPWQVLTNKGWAQYKAGRPDEARKTLGMALDFNPSYWPALLDLGILDSEEGKTLDAIERFNEVIAIAPGERATSEVNYRLGEVYVSIGRRDRAITHFTASIENSPRGPWGKRSEKYLKLLR